MIRTLNKQKNPEYKYRTGLSDYKKIGVVL